MASPEFAELQRINAQLATMTAQNTQIITKLQEVNDRLFTNTRVVTDLLTVTQAIEVDTSLIQHDTTLIAQNTAQNETSIGYLEVIQNLLASMLYVGSSGGVEPDLDQAQEYVQRYGKDQYAPS